MKFLPRWLRRPVERRASRPFARLTLHFLRALFQTQGENGEIGLNPGAGMILGILALPGAFVSIMLFDKYSSLLWFFRGKPAFDRYAASLPDKYFFIVFAMVVTGAVAVFKWDSILPARRDYLNLAPLPVSTRSIFGANLIALLVAGLIFSVDVNLASAILFPAVVLAENGDTARYLHFAFVHGLSLTLASVLTFFGCFSVMGALMCVLPPRIFRPVSLFIRIGILMLLVTLLATSFTVPREVLRLPQHPDSWLRWLPSVWYLGLYQALQGRASPQLAALAPSGIRWAWGAVFAAMVVCSLSYRRHFVRIPEATDMHGGVRIPGAGASARFCESVFLKSAFQRGCYWFAVKTLLRSEGHSLVLGAFIGLGIVLSVEAADLIAAGPILAYFLLLGLRVVFESPAGLQANWVFRSVLDSQAPECTMLARKILLSFVMGVVILPSTAADAALHGWMPAAAHGMVLLAGSVALTEIMLIRFRKIPFTCSFPPFQNHSIVLFLLGFVGFAVFTGVTGTVERWAGGSLLRWPWLMAAVVAGRYLLKWAKEDLEDEGHALVFEDRPVAAVQQLNLFDRG